MSKLNETAFIVNADTMQVEEHTLEELHKKYAYEYSFWIREEKDNYGDSLGFRVVFTRGRIDIPARDICSSQQKAMEAGEGYLIHHVYENAEVAVFSRREDAEESLKQLTKEGSA